MNIISDFSDIARRMNRKQETKPETTADESAAAVRTLKMLGYVYNAGCNLWKPPLGNGPAIPSWPIVDANYNNALFGSLKAQDLRRLWAGGLPSRPQRGVVEDAEITNLSR